MCSTWLIPIYWSADHKCYYIYHRDIEMWQNQYANVDYNLGFQIYNRTGHSDKILVYYQQEDGIRSYEYAWWDDEFETYWASDIKPNCLR